MLQSLRERFTFILLIALPFHALLVTILTRVLIGRFQDTPLWLTMWKEAALLLLIGWVVFEVLSKKVLRTKWYQLDTLDYILLSFGTLGLLISLYLGVPVKQLAYGIKYDFWPLAVLFVLRRVSWSTALKQQLQTIIPIVGIVIAVIGIVFMLVPASFLELLGYSETHSLFMAHKPVAAFQQIGASAIRRLQSTFSGPNQAGIWLLIPLGFVWAKLVSKLPAKYSFKGILEYKLKHLIHILFAIVILLGIFFTFSRSVWIASLVLYTVGLFLISKRVYAKNVATGTIVFLALIAVIASQVFPSVIKRDLSSKGHLEKPLEAVQTMLERPLGLGLGSAGPASNHLSDPCTMVEKMSDTSWADPYPELCLFMGTNMGEYVQVKPTDRECNCARVTENWYLQLGVELGILGLIFSIGLALYLAFMLYAQGTLFTQSVWLAFIGISTVGLFLHSWEDSAVAYGMAVLLAVALPPRNNEFRSSNNG